jgi:hypothetical protein
MTPLRRTCRLSLLTLFASLIAANGMAGAKEPTPLQNGAGCLHDEPDSVQISWEAPCQDGSWLMDTQLGCRMWDWHPAPEDKVTWTGACRAGVKMGRGVLQWYEHGRAIDRFEGTFVSGRRQGLGRYVWNETNWYEGVYESDLPHGPGTAHIAGEIFAGQWKRGCFIQGTRVLAVGVPRTSCEQPQERMVRQGSLRPN